MIFLFPNTLLIIVAVVPAIALLAYIYRQDRLEKEPLRLLLSLVLFGILSTIFASVAEQVGMWVLQLVFRRENDLYSFIFYFFVVGCAEEGGKYFLLKKRTWNNPNFDYRFDAIVYAVCVSLGFALWENISYVLIYGFQTAVARALTAVPGHACFGVLMGCWYGAAKEHENAGRTAESKKARRLAFWVPVIAHGFYDYIATTDSTALYSRFIVYILLLFFFAFRLVRRQSRNDRYIGPRGWNLPF